MAEQGSSSSPLISSGEKCRSSIASQPLEPSTATTDAETTLPASRSDVGSGSELPTSTHVPSSCLSMDINSLTHDFLDGLSLGGTTVANRGPATPRIDAALSRMVGLPALSQPETASTLQQQQILLPHTAPTSPATHPLGVGVLGSNSSPADHPSPPPSHSIMPSSLLPSPSHSAALSMLPSLPAAINGVLGDLRNDEDIFRLMLTVMMCTDPSVPGLLPFNPDNLLVHQQAMAHAGMVPVAYAAPPMVSRLSSVEAMVEALQHLPRRQSAVPHVAAHLYHLDKQVCCLLCTDMCGVAAQHAC